jgi:hypothetical protein
MSRRAPLFVVTLSNPDPTVPDRTKHVQAASPQHAMEVAAGGSVGWAAVSAELAPDQSIDLTVTEMP